MNQIPEKVYYKLEVVAKAVSQNLQRKGVAIPVKNDNGSVTLGNYTIVKRDNFYVIIDYSGEVVVDKINLPQSAAILANGLALGKFIDPEILSQDRMYGYAEFEEVLHKQMAERCLSKDLNRADVMFTKSNINRAQKEHYRTTIMARFEKLRRFA